MSEPITVIIPFYKGNIYIESLIKNILYIKNNTKANITDIIFVNDSPWVEVELPVLDKTFPIKIVVLKNNKNSGIQKSRVRGLRECATPLVIFLDQDDCLIADGFDSQVEAIGNADIVVGNGLYQFGERYKPIYKNEEVMKYLIQKKKFVEIRNMIPSPGCCLLRKESIPSEWMGSCLKINGADDWLLWLLMFDNKNKFAFNIENVYQHNSTESGNLSFDLDKMHKSCLEMIEILKMNDKLTDKERKTLFYAIEFKYFKDIKGYTVCNKKYLLKFIKPFFQNIVYKITTSVL